MNKTYKGFLIALEGVDGSGKSTLAYNLANACTDNQVPVLLTKEPGGSALGKILRDIVQKQSSPLDAYAEFLLFAADRAQHFIDVIIPYLDKGYVVISDRMADSSIVYQGYGRGLPLEFITMVNKHTMHTIKPDLTFYIKIDMETSRWRLHNRNIPLSSFEQDKTLHTQTLIDAFEALYQNRKDVITLDALQTPEYLTKQAWQTVQKWITENHR